MRVAFLGLGRMGRELVQHILDSGHEVRVFNRTVESARELSPLGAIPEASAAGAVADAEIVVSVLFGPDAVREVIVDPDLPIPAGALWIDVTTVAPDDADGFAGWAALRHLRYVHSPVLGSLAPARAGILGVLMGGSAEDVDAAASITGLWADPTRVHVYGTPGQAAAAKLLVNLGLAVATEALGEAVRLGGSWGLTKESVLAVLDKTPLAGIVAAKGQTIREGNFQDAQFTVDALYKDAGLAIAATPHPLPALEAAARVLAHEQAKGRGGWDFSVIAAAE